MTNIEYQLLELMKEYYCKAKAKDLMSDAGEKEWQELHKLCSIHKAIPIAYDGLCGLNSFSSMSEDFKATWKKQALVSATKQVRVSAEIIKLCSELDRNGVRFVVVKGIICRNLYINSDLRTSGDEDIFVFSDDFEDAVNVLKENGYRCKNSDDVLYAENGFAYIEMHHKLFDKNSESLNAYFNKALERRIEVSIEGIKVPTFEYTDGLFYLICHAIKHFVASGIGVRTVSDICKFAETYGKDIDWDRLMELADKAGSKRFFRALLNIGKEHLGFSYEAAQCPMRLFNERMDTEDLLSDIMDAGIFGQSSMSRKHSSLITKGAYQSEKSTALNAVFPSRDILKGRYPVLDKYPYLLPACWFHRIAVYGKELVMSKDNKDNNAVESVRIGKKRTKLMKKYDISVDSKQG